MVLFLVSFPAYISLQQQKIKWKSSSRMTVVPSWNSWNLSCKETQIDIFQTACVQSGSDWEKKLVFGAKYLCKKYIKNPTLSVMLSTQILCWLIFAATKVKINQPTGRLKEMILSTISNQQEVKKDISHSSSPLSLCCPPCVISPLHTSSDVRSLTSSSSLCLSFLHASPDAKLTVPRCGAPFSSVARLCCGLQAGGARLCGVWLTSSEQETINLRTYERQRT